MSPIPFWTLYSWLRLLCNWEGFEYTAKEKQQTADQLNSMLSAPNPSYIIKMAEAYFVKKVDEGVHGESKEESALVDVGFLNQVL